MPASASLLFLSLCLAACATTPHGTISTRTLDAAGSPLCDHRVPERACTRHHPELVAEFKATGDWCAEHERPESQCLICHPDLSFEPLPALPSTADLAWVSVKGEPIGALEKYVMKGKVTVFDFYADWCAPCRKVDQYLYLQLGRRGDLAVRKVNVPSWESAVAREHLSQVPTLPYLLVWGADGQRRGSVAGFDLERLDALLKEATP